MDHSSSECLFELFYKIDPSVILDIYQFHQQDFDKTVSALIDINSEINIDENEELLDTLEQYSQNQEVVEERNEINDGINDGNSAFFDVGSGSGSGGGSDGSGSGSGGGVKEKLMSFIRSFSHKKTDHSRRGAYYQVPLEDHDEEQLELSQVYSFNPSSEHLRKRK